VVAGNKAIMETVGEGVAHSGTYTGHLFAIMAGLATLEEIHRPGFYDHLYAVGNKLYTTLQEGFDRYGVPARVQGVGARFGIFFGTREPVNSVRDVVDFDAETATRFYQGCFAEGLYFHTYSRTRAGQMGYSASHTLADIDLVAEKIDRVLRQMTT
jgi:glutamate-1-semialdehyde 2,1-aminomutase